MSEGMNEVVCWVMDATFYEWSEVAQDNPIPLLYRRLLKGKNLMVARVRLEKGCVVESHAHESEQIAVMLSGRAKWTLGADQREVVITEGNVLHLPPNVRHGVEALEDCEVIDILSPVGPMGVDAQQAIQQR